MGAPMMKRLLLAALLTVSLAAEAAAQANSALVQRLDSIAGYWVQREYAVGIVAAVVQGDDTLLMQSYGKADVRCTATARRTSPAARMVTSSHGTV